MRLAERQCAQGRGSSGALWGLAGMPRLCICAPSPSLALGRRLGPPSKDLPRAVGPRIGRYPALAPPRSMRGRSRGACVRRIVSKRSSQLLRQRVIGMLGAGRRGFLGHKGRREVQAYACRNLEGGCVSAVAQIETYAQITIAVEQFIDVHT